MGISGSQDLILTAETIKLTPCFWRYTVYDPITVA